MRTTPTASRYAYTLVELLVIVAIMVALLGALLPIFAFMTRLWGTQLSYAMAVQQTNMSLQLMTREIHQSMSFATLTSGSNTVYAFTLPSEQDSNGNYVPVSQNGVAAYGTGIQVAYYLSDSTGSLSKSNGQSLWRATLPAGQTIWTPDTTWSRYNIGTTRYANVQSFIISTSGMPTNTVNISLQMKDIEGAQSRTCSVSQSVAMVNNSNSLGN